MLKKLNELFKWKSGKDVTKIEGGAIVTESVTSNRVWFGDQKLYAERHEDLVWDYLDLQKQLREANDHNVDLQEIIAKMDKENAAMGNCLFEILNQDTPSSNATVKRIMAMTKSTLGIDVK